MIYLIGSLRNPEVPILAQKIRTDLELEVFDDWHGNGPEADDYWQKYEKNRGRSYRDALASPIPQNIFRVDRENIQKASTVVLVLPAGKSGHLEFGYAMGIGKIGYILLPGEPERYDVMYNFATNVFVSQDELMEKLRNDIVLKTAQQLQQTSEYDVIAHANAPSPWTSGSAISTHDARSRIMQARQFKMQQEAGDRMKEQLMGVTDSELKKYLPNIKA